jgi:uncharacterized protein
VLGYPAALTGIGGGVFLKPLLILLHWTPAKVAGGISARFILVNSVARLGKAAVHGQPRALFASLLGAVGALAVVLWIAAARLWLTGK